MTSEDDEKAVSDVWDARRFSAILLSPVGGFALVVGAHDAFASAEVASRAGGWLLLVAGICLCTAVVLLFLKGAPVWVSTVGILVSPLAIGIGVALVGADLLTPDRNISAVVIAVLVVAAVAAGAVKSRVSPKRSAVGATCVLLLFLIISVVSGDRWQPIFLWAWFASNGAIAMYALWDARPPTFELSATRVLVTVGGVITLGALVSVAQFWYTSQYLPTTLPASLTVSTDLEQLEGSDDADVVRVTLTVENTAQTQAKILGSVYRATGSRVELVRSSKNALTRNSARPALTGKPVARYHREHAWDVLQVGRIFPDQSWLDPGEVHTTEFLVHLPAGRYEVVRSSANLLIAKGRALSIDQTPRFGPEVVSHGSGVRGVFTEWDIRETSWVRLLTRDHRIIRVGWLASEGKNPDPDAYPRLSAEVYREDDEPDGASLETYNEDLAGIYGLAETTPSVAELPLSPQVPDAATE